MASAPRSDSWTRESLLRAWTSPVLLEVLDVIADGIRDVTGFGVAAFAVVRNHNELEYVAVSGGDTDLDSLVGTFVPLDDVRAEWERGQPVGRFVLIPEDRRRMPARWHSAPPTLTSTKAWRQHDLLIAPLRDDTDTVIGTLTVDVPADGLRPDTRQLRLLDTFADYAARALQRALSYDAMSERVDLTGRLRAIVRHADTRCTPFEVFTQTADAIRVSFGCAGVSAQLYDEDLDPDDPPPILRPDGSVATGSLDLWRKAVTACQAAWEHNTVVLVGEGRVGSSFMEPDHHAAVLDHLRSVGLSSGVQVPLYVGHTFLGAIFLTRAAEKGPWTDEQLAAATELGLDIGEALMNARLHARDQQLLEQMREIDRYKTQLISQISHEFRSPLTSIAGHLELTEDNEGTLPPPSLAAMRRGTDRLVRLTEQLLTLSRITETGYCDERCDAVDAVDGALALCADCAESRGVEVQVEFAHGPLPVVGASYDLELLATNLIDNAIKYSDAGDRVSLRLASRQDTVVLEVVDEGIGIAVDDQAHLFEEFFRSSRAEAMSRPGSGLGLSIVARVVERLGATIEIQSVEDEGCTVTVTLLAAEPRPDEAG